jgi:hypothetical protein
VKARGICCKALRDLPARDSESGLTNPFPKHTFLKTTNQNRLRQRAVYFLKFNYLLSQAVLIRKKSRKSSKTFGILIFKF